jgi:DNA-binding NarL/FixJ family response regulator
LKDNKNMKLFIVDDDPFCRALYQQLVINLGYENNALFDNGVDCIKKLDELPDIIFLDYDMKPLNGIEILKMIKQQNPNIYLMMISSQSDRQHVSNAFKCGADEYIIKGENDLEMIRQAITKVQLASDYNSLTGIA